MRDSTVRTLGLLASACYAGFIVSIYVHQPQSLMEVTASIGADIGVYRIDQPAFDEGLRLFRSGQFEAARSAFDRADPAHKDAHTQFYIAYACYRQGWGRLYDDDQLFKLGLDAANRSVALAPHGILRVDDQDLGMKTADELRAELEAGLRRDISDFNPMKILRRRK